MTALTVTRVGRIADHEEAMEQIRDGLVNAVAALQIAEIERAYELHGSEFDPPGIPEWAEQVSEAAAAEVAPAVAALLQAAIDKRLPWTSR